MPSSVRHSVCTKFLSQKSYRLLNGLVSNLVCSFISCTYQWVKQRKIFLLLLDTNFRLKEILDIYHIQFKWKLLWHKSRLLFNGLISKLYQWAVHVQCKRFWLFSNINFCSTGFWKRLGSRCIARQCVKLHALNIHILLGMIHTSKNTSFWTNYTRLDKKDQSRVIFSI